MMIKKLFVLFFSLLTFNFALFTAPVYADTTCDPSICPSDDSRLSCLNEVTNKCEQQLQNAKKQEKTLKSQLDLIDGQTRVTSLKIQETNLKIDKLKREISDLSTRIDRISGTLDSLSEVLLKRIVQTYKYGNAVSTFDLIFSSTNITDLLQKLKYIQVAQASDKKQLYELQATKLTYNDQKQDKLSRQQEAEKLSKDLDVYKKQLDDQKKAKDTLLRITKNDEAVFQANLQAALDEQQAILAITGNATNEISDGQAHKGDVIGHYILGRSACSSGSHLHFEVHQNNQIVNPAGLLSSHSINWDNSPDGTFSFGGPWDLWPVSDPVSIAQGYGMTWWAQHGWYGGGPHTGIDLYASSSDVRSVHDGSLSHGGIACGGGTLRYKRVDHGDGYSSYYLHVI